MKLKITFFFVLHAFISFGQEKIAEFEPKMKITFNTKLNAYANDELTRFSLSFHGDDELNAVLLNKSFGVEKNLVFSDPTITTFDSYIGYLTDGNKFTFYYIKNGKLMYRTIDFLSETLSNGESLDLRTKDGFKNVKYLSSDGKFFVLRAKENWGVLEIYEFSGEKEYKQYKFGIKPDISNLLIHNKFRVPPGAFDNRGVVKFFDPINCYPGIGNNFLWNIYKYINTFKCKIAYFDHIFYFCIDEPNSNFVLILNLDSKKIIEKHYVVEKKSYTTLCLSKHTLFQLTTTEDSLKISMTNLKDDKVVKEYSAGLLDSIEFKNTPIFKNYRGNITSKNEYGTTKEFLSRVDHTTPFITVVPVKDSLRMIVGSLNCNTSATMLLNPQLVRMSEDNNLVFSNPQLGGGPDNSNLVLSSYFESLIQEDTFDHIDGNIPPWSFELVESYKKEKGDAIKYETEFNIELNDCTIFGYYNKKTKKYEIIKLF